MWASLKKDGSHFADKLDYVLQERMWDQYDGMIKAGWNAADAKMIAWQDNLMLTPEQDQESVTRERAERILAKNGMTIEDCPPALLDHVMDKASDW